LIWVSPPGDYAIINSNHIPDGTICRPDNAVSCGPCPTYALSGQVRPQRIGAARATPGLWRNARAAAAASVIKSRARPRARFLKKRSDHPKIKSSVSQSLLLRVREYFFDLNVAYRERPGCLQHDPV